MKYIITHGKSRYEATQQATQNLIDILPDHTKITMFSILDTTYIYINPRKLFVKRRHFNAIYHFQHKCFCKGDDSCVYCRNGRLSHSEFVYLRKHSVI